MKIQLIVSNVVVALLGIVYVYEQMQNSNQLDLGAVTLLVLGVVNTVVVSTRGK